MKHNKEKTLSQETKKKCLISSLVQAENQSSQTPEQPDCGSEAKREIYRQLDAGSSVPRQQRQSEISFGKHSLPPTATPKTQLTNRKSKQVSIVSIQQLVSQPILRRDKTLLSKINQFVISQDKSCEKTVDLQSMSESKRYTWVEKQRELAEQQSGFNYFTERTHVTNRMQYLAKATNYNNFVRRYASTNSRVLMSEKIAVLKTPRKKVVQNHGPKDRQFVFRQAVVHARGVSSHILRQKKNKEASPRLEQSTFRSDADTARTFTALPKPRKLSQNQQRYELSELNREKFSNYYTNGVDSLRLLKENKRDPDLIFKELHIDEIQYTDLERAQKCPINLPLFNMLKEEEIILKQRQVEECERYNPNELIVIMRENEKIDEQTRREYHRRSYNSNSEYMPIQDGYKLVRSYHRQKGSHPVDRKAQPVPVVAQKKAKRTISKIKVLHQIKQFLFKLNDLRLTLPDLIEKQALPPHAYFRQRSKVFIDSVKNNNLDQVKAELEINKFLVHDFDYGKMTGLHHAVIRNYPDMVVLLLKSFADVNAKDLLGRTPLTYAMRSNNNECITILLVHRANPWSNSKNPYDQYLDQLDDKVREQYRMARRLHLQMQMLPYCKRDEFWTSKLFNFEQKEN